MDERGLKKLHAAAVHLREVADEAHASVNHQEEKVARFRELLAEVERGLDETRATAEQCEREAAEAEQKSEHWRNVERGIEQVYAHAQPADVRGEVREG